LETLNRRRMKLFSHAPEDPGFNIFNSWAIIEGLQGLINLSQFSPGRALYGRRCVDCHEGFRADHVTAFAFPPFSKAFNAFHLDFLIILLL